MSTRNRWSRWLAMFLAVAMMLNTQGMTALADVIGIVTDRKDQTADGSGMADPGAGEERENIVTFSVSQGASVTVDGADATNTTAMARDGRIVFTVTAAEGYQVSSVLVDRTKEARKNEATEAPDDYIIEGIKTDETVVTVETKTAETEETQTEAETAKLIVNHMAEVPGEDGDLKRIALAEPEIFTEGLKVGDEIVLADYAKDFSPEYSVEYVSGETDTVVLEKETTVELVYAPVMASVQLMANDAMSRAATVTIKVGEKKNLTGSGTQYHDTQDHHWAVSNRKKATVAGNGNSATVTGKAKGTVTVTHTYESRDIFSERWTEREETFAINIEDADTSTGSTRVYVYVRFELGPDVSLDGWQLNNDGWYTIGYVDVPIPSPQNYSNGSYHPDYLETVTSALGSINYYKGNQSVSQGLDLFKVDWSASGYGLKVADGAADYSGEAPNGTKQWHLDGYVKIEKIEQHTVTINYVYEDGTTAAPTYSETVETGTVVRIDSPDIKGFTPDQETVTVNVSTHDVTVTVTYREDFPTEEIVIRAANAEKPYDGTPLENSSYTYTQNVLKDGDVLTATVSGSRTEAGTTANEVTDYQVMRGDKCYSAN